MVGERFVGTVDPLLEFRLPFLAAGGDSLDPDPQGFPVDPEDHLESEKRILQGEAEKRGVRQRDPVPRQHADEFLFPSSVIVDEQTQSFPGLVESEIELKVEVREGGDIEVLHGAEMEGALRGDRDKIWLPLAEGIAHLSHGGQWFSFRIKTEKDRDGVEDISQEPRQGEEQDPSDGSRDSLFTQIAENIFPGRGRPVGDVVRVAVGIQAGTIDPEESHGPVEFVQLAEIEKEVKDAVKEFMPLGSHPPVEDGALVEAGVHGAWEKAVSG
jgi:hypothetical protein